MGAVQAIEKLHDKLKRLRREKLEKLRVLKQYVRDHRLEYFKPHAKQTAWFKALDDESIKTIGFQGGNRVGKTTVSIATIVSLCLGYYPWRKTQHGAHVRTRFRPPIKVRLCGEDKGHHLKEILVPKLREFLPPHELAWTRKDGTGLETYWGFKNGSTIELMSYEQETAIFEGWDGHVVAFDEPPPRDKYIALKRGLVDHDGIMLLTFTPLKEPWIYDELVTKADPRIRFIVADTRDNPHLPKQAIEEFERALTEEEKTSRIGGGWLFLQGLVYKEFDRNVHVVPPFKDGIIPPDYSCYAAIDTHPRTEQAVLFVAVDEKDRIFVVDEKFRFGTPNEVADWCVHFHKKVGELSGVLIDPSSQGDQNRGDSTFSIIEQRLAQFGIPLETGSKDLAGGILKVKDALRSRNGQPSLFVFNTCARTLHEFGRYIWDEWRDAGLKTAKQRPRDKDDHMMECLRRLVQHPVTYRSKSAIQDYLNQANAGPRFSDPLAGY